MNRDSAHRCSPNEAFSPAKVLHLGRQFLHRFRGNARVKPVGLVPFLVEEGLRTENRMMRENAAAEHDGIRSGETVFANVDRLRGLPAGVEIDAVGKQLRAKSTDGGKRADPHPRGAIDEMPAADPRMLFDDQLRATLRLVGEMPAWPAGKTSDPVELSDDGVRAEMKQIDVFAEGQMTDAGALFHHKFSRKNPGESDAARRMNRITELFFEERAAQTPRQKKRENPEQRLHAAAPSDR